MNDEKNRENEMLAAVFAAVSDTGSEKEGNSIAASENGNEKSRRVEVEAEVEKATEEANAEAIEEIVNEVEEVGINPEDEKSDTAEEAELKPFEPKAVKPGRFISPAEAGIRQASEAPSKAATAKAQENETADAAAAENNTAATANTEADTSSESEEKPAYADEADTTSDEGSLSYDEQLTYYAERAERLSEEDIRAAVANPLFALFARGKNQPFDEICRDFLRMTVSTHDAGSRRMVTPAGFSAVNRDVSLSDRQRKLAREYGMSYREYYDLINGIPTKLYK
ncbi:MAG: hypothetical protein ACI3XF_07160 [Eubacteriales bacterium]